MCVTGAGRDKSSDLPAFAPGIGQGEGTGRGHGAASHSGSSRTAFLFLFFYFSPKHPCSGLDVLSGCLDAWNEILSCGERGKEDFLL